MFNDTTREYVISNPQTPYPWINYLGTDRFFSLVSNTAGGYCFYRDAKFRRITRYRYNSIPVDNGGRYFYIKDGDTVWNPGWKPTKTPLDSYECRHGMGYTSINSSRCGIEASLLLFVPLNQNVEIHKLTLTNNTDSPRTLHLYSFIEWCLWNAQTDMENFQRNLSTGEVEIDGSTIYHKTEYKERRNHYAFYSVNCPISGFETDRDAFLGLYNGLENPDVVAQGTSTNSVALGWSPVASHHIELTLQPGEARTLVFLLGYAENDETKFENATPRLLTSEQQTDIHVVNKTVARDIISRYQTTQQVDEAFGELKEYWSQLLSHYQVESGEPRLDRMVNIWNQYQCMVTFNFSRSASYFVSGIGRGMGFRDSNQDLVGFVHQIPERARERIIDIASTQFPDGSCYHQYQPLTKRGNNDIGGGFNDDPLWLIFGTVAYLKETGDMTILDELVPFDNQVGSEVSLLRHLRISFDHVLNNLGPHGLPLIGRADWNDCLNLNCFSLDPNESFQTTENKSDGSQAESLMIAGLFIVAGRDYAELCRYIGDTAEAERAERAVSEMVEAVKRYGWDGEWYLRAYDYYGRKIGTHESEEGKIFIESQGWCAMAGVGREEGMCDRALDSVKRYLDSEHGIRLNYPAYHSYQLHMGEISSYPAGYKENAGIFCHNNPWVIIGEVLAGRAADAWEHYTKISPAYITDYNLHKLEPYVYSQMIAGPDARHFGQAKNSWLTGTAAWNWLAVSQYILGIHPHYDGLIISPCLPASLRDLRITRRFRGATYTIRIHNSGSGNAPSVVLDGCPLESNHVPYTEGEHSVEVEM